MKRIKYIVSTMLVVFSLVVLQSCHNPGEATIGDDYFSDLSDYDLSPDELEQLISFFECQLPQFPLEVLYVIAKEYELAESGESEKTYYNGIEIAQYTKPQYVEQRLLELFPTVAYEGVVADAQALNETLEAAYADYLDQTMEWQKMRNDSTIFWDEQHEFVSDSDEIQFMQMTSAEVNLMNQYNQLAALQQFATLKDIYSVAGQSESFKAASFNWVAFGCVAVAVGAYTFLRALICANRAYSKAEYYYGELKSGKPSDAFKHMAVSMMLRRYLTQPMSYLIMDVYYENAGHNAPCSKHMDIHNNYVGRCTKYSLFRGAYFSDMYKWELWLQRIKTFVDDSSNGVFMNWDLDTPENVVESDLENVSRSKYVYYLH